MVEIDADCVVMAEREGESNPTSPKSDESSPSVLFQGVNSADLLHEKDGYVVSLVKLSTSLELSFLTF